MTTMNSKKVRDEYAQRLLSETEAARKNTLKELSMATLLISTYRTWLNVQNGHVDY